MAPDLKRKEPPTDEAQPRAGSRPKLRLDISAAIAAEAPHTPVQPIDASESHNEPKEPQDERHKSGVNLGLETNEDSTSGDPPPEDATTVQEGQSLSDASSLRSCLRTAKTPSRRLNVHWASPLFEGKDFRKDEPIVGDEAELSPVGEDEAKLPPALPGMERHIRLLGLLQRLQPPNTFEYIDGQVVAY